MGPVLETEARPDTAEARRAGDSALGVGVMLVLSLLAFASALVARPAPAAPSDRSTPLPVLASGADADAVWDGAELSGGHLLVVTGSENGRVATVRGGASWRDYTLRARLRWLAGERVSLLVREQDAASYVACVLEGPAARIEEVSGGVSRTLASARLPEYRGRAFDAVVTAEGRRIALAVDGATVASAEVRIRTRGTAGLAVWDPRWGNAAVEAEYVRVEPRVFASGAEALPAGAPVVSESVDRGE